MSIEEGVSEDNSSYNPMKYIGVKSAEYNEKGNKRSKIMKELAVTPSEKTESLMLTTNSQNMKGLLQKQHPRGNSRSVTKKIENSTTYNQKFPIISNANAQLNKMGLTQFPSGTITQSNFMLNSNFPTSKTTAIENENSKNNQEIRNFSPSAKNGNKPNPANNNNTNTNAQFTYEDVVSRSSNYSCITCQYCLRKFAPKSAERHIPICKDLKGRTMIKPHTRETIEDIGGSQGNVVGPSEMLKSFNHTQQGKFISGDRTLERLSTTNETRKNSAEVDRIQHYGKLMRINMGKQ